VKLENYIVTIKYKFWSAVMRSSVACIRFCDVNIVIGVVKTEYHNLSVSEARFATKRVYTASPTTFH